VTVNLLEAVSISLTAEQCLSPINFEVVKLRRRQKYKRIKCHILVTYTTIIVKVLIHFYFYLFLVIILVERVSFIQKRLEELVKVIVPTHPIDIGAFTAKTLEEIIRESKNYFDVEFDDVRVYPIAQPRESSDIELLKDNEVVKKINLKTAVSGNIGVALRKLAKTIRDKEIGALAFFVLLYREENEADAKIIIAIIPSEVFFNYDISDIYEVIISKVEQKIEKEKYLRWQILAVNEAIELMRAKEAILAHDAAEKAKKIAEEARDEAKKAREEAEKAKKIVEELKGEVKKIYEIVRRVLEILEG